MGANVKKIIESAYNGVEVFAMALQNVSVIALYGGQNSVIIREGRRIRTNATSDFRDDPRRNEIKYVIKNIAENPSLINVANTLEVINTYDFCNPLNFAINNLFPPGSEVANTFDSIQIEINEVVNSIRKFSIVENVQQNIAVSPNDPIPFVLGKIELSTTDENKFTKGSFVSITQTTDPKVTSTMRGTIDEVRGNNYIINIESISPPIPPFQKGSSGNVLTDDSGEPIPEEYSNFIIEGSTQLSSDTRELAVSLDDLTNELRNIDINTIRLQIETLPSSLPGIGNLKSSLRDFQRIVDQETGEVANITGTSAQFLAGNITSEEVISRIRKIRDFYYKILPYTDLKFSLTDLFKKQIEDINRTLRDVVPYDEISFLVRQVSYITKFILSLVNFTIGIVVTINNIIKTINVVLKVVKVVLKVIKKIIKVLPLIPFIPAVVIQAPTDFIVKLEVGIQRALDLLIKLSNELTLAENSLRFVKYYLQIILKETTILASKLESCEGLNNSGLQESLLEANRNSFFALQNLLESIPNLDKYEAGQFGQSVVNKTGVNTFVVIDGQGTIMPLPDSVFGFDEFGNILFYGDLTSLSTGVSFEDTLGQDFRSSLNYYTFNKFEAAKHGPLIQSADNLYLENQTIADPEDAFGNFQEVYLGYTLKIQEDKPIDKNEQTLLRRRGIALDSNNNIIVATDLTFSDDLEGIINELKYRIDVRVQEGIIGVNTTDKLANEITDSDAQNIATDIGVNQLELNNIKSEANNRANNNISSGNAGNSIEGKPIDPNTPIETRIGGQPFQQDQSMGGGDITSVSNIQDKESSGRIIDTTSLIDSIVKEQQENDPRIKAISDTLKTLNSVDSKTLSDLLKSPNSQNLSDEELFSTLKEQVLSSFDPNPAKIDEVRKKTEQWYEGLRNSTRLDWEQLTLNYRPPQRPAPPSYEDYFTEVEQEALPKWIKTLLRSGYTENEIQIGIDNVSIRDKYTLKIGPEPSKVKVTLRPAFRRKR
jgi:hypothetical protein